MFDCKKQEKNKIHSHVLVFPISVCLAVCLFDCFIYHIDLWIWVETNLLNENTMPSLYPNYIDFSRIYIDLYFNQFNCYFFLPTTNSKRKYLVFENVHVLIPLGDTHILIKVVNLSCMCFHMNTLSQQNPLNVPVNCTLL